MKKRILVLLTSLLLITVLLPTKISADNDPAPQDIIKLSYTKRTVEKGKHFEILAFTTPYEAEDDLLVWDTSDPTIVGFEDGERTGDEVEFVALNKGTARVTCTIAGTKISKDCLITVSNSNKARIVTDEKFVDVDQYEWEDLEAKLIGGTFKNRKLTYKVKDKSIAKVKNGKVYGKSVGSTKITIRAKAKKSIKKVIYVSVEAD